MILPRLVAVFANQIADLTEEETPHYGKFPFLKRFLLFWLNQRSSIPNVAARKGHWIPNMLLL